MLRFVRVSRETVTESEENGGRGGVEQKRRVVVRALRGDCIFFSSLFPHLIRN